MRLSKGQPVTTNVGVMLFELEEHTIGIWLHISGGLNNEEVNPDVDGNNEKVDDEVLFCLK